MSVPELEASLKAWRSGDEGAFSSYPRLGTDEALAYRDRGNVPDAAGRTLRMVLWVKDESELADIEARRLALEPDHHSAPRWRREGSKPVHVVPLRPPELEGTSGPWWQEPEVGALEEEWRAKGTIGGLRASADYRSFLYKTVISLRRAGEEVSIASICDSLARWLGADEVARIRGDLEEAARRGP